VENSFNFSDLTEQPKKRGPKTSRSLSPKNEIRDGAAIVIRPKSTDSSKTAFSVGVVVSRNAYTSATNERKILDNEVPVRCLPKGDYRLFKAAQISLYDENKTPPESINNKTREACEILTRYKNKGRLPNGWTDESIYGLQTPVKKSRKAKRQNPKNVPRREKFYRQLKTYYKNIVDLPNFIKTNPVINGTEIDLCRLFFTVRQEGGYRAVLFSDKWSKIAVKLKLADQVSGDELRELYHRLVDINLFFD
jgi:hypothetical protein